MGLLLIQSPSAACLSVGSGMRWLGEVSGSGGGNDDGPWSFDSEVVTFDSETHTFDSDA